MAWDQQLTQGITALLLIALIGGALAISLSSFRDQIGEDDCRIRTDGFTTYNTTSKQCQNGSGSQVVVGTTEYNTSVNGLSGLGNATSYLDTIGTLLGVGALVAVVVGAFMYFGRRPE